jgi:trehalose-phosphatase
LSLETEATGWPHARDPGAALPSALTRLDKIVARFVAARPAFFLDFDGTLAPIVPHPDEARAVAGTADVLRRLAARFPVVVVSGRRLDDVRLRLGLDFVGYAGEHGLVLQDGRGVIRAPVLRPGHLAALQAAAHGLRVVVEREPGAWLEPKECALAVHVRPASPEGKRRIAAAVRAVVGTSTLLRVMAGKEVYEVRPDVEWDKGDAVMHLLQRLGGDARYHAFVIGDDTTDEDAFRAAGQTGVAIRVGAPEEATRAAYVLADPGEVVVFLERLAARLGV